MGIFKFGLVLGSFVIINKSVLFSIENKSVLLFNSKCFILIELHTTQQQ